MSKTRPRLAHEYEAPIARLTAKLADREAEEHRYLSGQVLHLDADKLRQSLGSVRKEITAIRADLEEERALQAAAQTIDAAAAAAAEVEAHQSDAVSVGTLRVKALELAQQIVGKVNELGPLLREFEAVANEAGALSYSVHRGGVEAQNRAQGLGSARSARSQWEAVRELAGLKNGALATGITVALWDCGIGRIGPHAHVTVQPPPRMPGRVKSDMWLDPNANVSELMAAEFDRESSKVANVLARSLGAIRGAEAA